MIISFIKNLSFQAKLLGIIVLTSLVTLLITSYISFSNSRSFLETQAYNQLNGFRYARLDSIQDYFKQSYQEALILSESPLFLNATKELIPAYKKLSEENSVKLTPEQTNKLNDYYKKVFIPELNKHTGENFYPATFAPASLADAYTSYYYTATNPYHFPDQSSQHKPKDGSEFTQVHNKYNSQIRRIAKAFDYEDIYLIDIKTGTVLYSLAKGVDLGANLNDGFMQTTGLAKAFRAAKNSRDPNFVTAIDFERYAPALGEPSAFISTTIFDNKDFIGALVFRINPHKIDQTLSSNFQWEKVGMGKTGEIMLVGQDRLVRSTPRPFLQDPEKYFKAIASQGASLEMIDAIKSAGSPILLQKNNAQAASLALEGKSGTLLYKDYLGNDAIASYQPVKLGDFQWGLIAKINQSEVFAGINNLSRQLLVMAAILIPLLTFLSIWLARLFMKPIRQLVLANKQVASGDTNVNVNIQSSDEFGQLGRSFNNMVKTIAEKESIIQSQLAENERLLFNILPISAAKRVKSGTQPTVDYFENVTVLFAEIEQFDRLTETLSLEDSMILLNEIIQAFDESAETFGVEKLQLPGTKYLATCGISVPRVDHIKRTVDFALAMLDIINRFSQKKQLELTLDIGVHSGPVSAGIVGKSKFNYSLWGETMDTVEAIHLSPLKNVIQVSEPVYNALQGLYHFESVEPIQLRGHGTTRTIPIWVVTPLGSNHSQLSIKED